jgi:hypothetical protein
MGAPMPEMEPVENETAEALLSSLKTIAAGERRKHASVFNYWQSIRQDRQFPPIRDLDPLEISDAGPWSILLEMAGGGDDAVVRHFGQAIRLGLEVEKIGQAPQPSLLAAIHNKLPIVAACRQAFAFEEAFDTDEGQARCWVTLLPFSETGTWIDYVYGFVSLDLPGTEGAAEEAMMPADEAPEAIDETVEEPEVEAAAEVAEDTTDFAEEPQAFEEPAAEVEGSFEPFKVPLGRLDDDEGAEPDEPLELTEQPVEAVVEPGAEAELESAPEPEPELTEMAVEPEPVVEPEEWPEPAPEAEPELAEESYTPEAMVEHEAQYEPVAELSADYEPEPEYEESKPSFSAKLLDSLATFSGFHGRVVQTGPLAEELPDEEPVDETEEAEPVAETASAEPEALELVDEAAEFVADEPAVQPTLIVEGNLHSKLTDVRAKAEEARLAQLACDQALYEGLGAAYDFALDAEHAPEEYLRLVEAQGLKIQLRSPMAPVARLAFEGTCDEASFAQLEAILAWALKQDLPRGSLPERIEAEGGIGQILSGLGRAA